MVVFIIKVIATVITVAIGSFAVLFDFKTNGKINKKGKIVITLILLSGGVGIIAQETERRNNVRKEKVEATTKFKRDSLLVETQLSQIRYLDTLTHNMKFLQLGIDDVKVTIDSTNFINTEQSSFLRDQFN